MPREGSPECSNQVSNECFEFIVSAFLGAYQLIVVYQLEGTAPATLVQAGRETLSAALPRPEKCVTT